MTYDPKRAWNISATEITLPDSDGYFLYIKVPTAAGENTSEFIVDKGYVVPSRDAGYFICPWGYIHPPVGGSREYSPYWGNKRGSNGQSAYVYIAYASADDGTGFTMTFNSSLDYIAIKATTTPIASPAASDFVGLWKKYKGEPASLSSIPYDIDFEFVDFTAGTAKTYTLDLKAQKAYTIAGVVLETDTGTLTINVKIGTTAVTGLDTLSATNTLTETTATANNSVAVGNRVYFEITSTYTGSPKVIRGKLLRTLS